MRKSCGQVTASHNRYGLFLMTRKATPASGSSYWHTIRDQGKLISKNWKILTEDQRILWNTNAKLFKRSDCIGMQYYQSGFNFYVGTNLNRWLCGEAWLSSPPAPVYVPLFNNLSIAATSAPATKIITFTPAISSAHKVKLWITQGLSAGINRAYHQFRLLTLLDDSFHSGNDIQTIYAARIWPKPDSGNKLFLKAIFIDKNTGLIGQPIYASTLII